MVDLQEEFIAASQNDERLHTFVVHLPTLGATEENVPAAMELLDGPRVTHYWNGGRGEIGHQYTEVLEIDPVYAWDVWLAYPADVLWENELPPSPSFWQHQLGLDNAPKLDPPVFAAQTKELLDQVGG
jgi:hypothetical protein